MLAKNFRLSKEQDFKRVFSKGQKIFAKTFIIRFLPNLEKNIRLAVIVSNKISKKATIRNKIRRRVRDVFKQNLGNFKCNCDIIVTVLPSSLDLKFKELKVELIDSLVKAKIV